MDVDTELHQRLSEIDSHLDLAAAAALAHDSNAPIAAALQHLHELSDHALHLYLSDRRQCELALCLRALESACEEVRALWHSASLDEAWQEVRDLRRQIDHS